MTLRAVSGSSFFKCELHRRRASSIGSSFFLGAAFAGVFFALGIRFPVLVVYGSCPSGLWVARDLRFLFRCRDPLWLTPVSRRNQIAVASSRFEILHAG